MSARRMKQCGTKIVTGLCLLMVLCVPAELVLGQKKKADFDGIVYLVNNGAYVARFQVAYTYKGQKRQYQDEHLGNGEQRAVAIPQDATAISISADARIERGAGQWRRIFRKDIEYSFNITHAFYRTTGTAARPDWDNHVVEGVIDLFHSSKRRVEEAAPQGN